MKPVSLVVAPVLALALVACQPKGAPAPAAAASPSAAAAPAAAAPAAAAPAAAAPGAPAEAAPAGALAEAPAPAAVPAARPTAAPRRAAAPLAPAGPATARNEPAPAEPVAAAPAPTPKPTPAPLVLAEGTVLPVQLQDTLTTKTAQPEDRVVAVTTEDVLVGGAVAVPAGSEVYGSVVSSVRSGRVKGRAHIVVSFDQVRVGHRTYDVALSGFDVTAGSSKGKDAKIAGGAAAAGVVIGAIAGGGKGALKGGAIGGAAGGAAVLATRGEEVTLPAGTSYRLTLKKALTIPR